MKNDPQILTATIMGYDHVGPGGKNPYLDTSAMSNAWLTGRHLRGVSMPRPLAARSNRGSLTTVHLPNADGDPERYVRVYKIIPGGAVVAV